MNATSYPRPASLVRNSLLFVVLGIAFGFVGSLLGGAVLGIVYLRSGGVYPPEVHGVMVSLVTIVGNLGAYFLVFRNFGRRSGLALRAVVTFRRPDLGLAAGFAVLMVGLYFVLYELDTLLKLALPLPQWLDGVFGSLMSSDIKLLGLINIVLIPALFEETLFRGYFIEGLRGKKSMRYTIILTSVLFGLVHLNPWQFVTGGLLGLLFGWVAWRTGSILLPVLGHAATNFISLLAVWYPAAFASVKLEAISGNELKFLPWPVTVGALGFVLVGYILVRKALARLPDPACLVPAVRSPDTETSVVAPAMNENLPLPETETGQ